MSSVFSAALTSVGAFKFILTVDVEVSLSNVFVIVELTTFDLLY